MTMPLLVGRATACEQVRSFARGDSAEGAGLLIVGDPGIGKTALLDMAADVAVFTGTRVLRAEGIEFETDVSYAVLNQLLVTATESFERLSDLHRRALTVALGLDDGPVPDRLVVANAAYVLLRSLAADQPMLLVVDDLPWIDRTSSFVLGFIARRLAGTAVTLIAGQRSGEESLLERARMTTLHLQPLDDQDATSLISSRFPDLADDVVQRLVADSQGIPLALVELPRELTAKQQSSHVDLPLLLPLGRHLSALFSTRIAKLTDASRAILLMAALESTALPYAESYLQNDDGVDHLAPVEHARLLSVDPETRRLTFTHPLIRSAVVEMATAGERQTAHRRLAVLFAADPDAQARHLGEATTDPDEAVAELLDHAAYRVLGRGDARAAVVALLRAADLSALGSSRARRLSEAAYIGADSTGALEVVPQLLARARRADPGGDSLSAAVAAAYVLLSEGDVETAHRLVTAAIEATPQSMGGHIIEEARYTLLMMSFYGARPIYWADFRIAMQRSEKASAILDLSASTLADPARSTIAQRNLLDATTAELSRHADPNFIARVAVAAIWLDRIGDCRAALQRIADADVGAGAKDNVPAVRAQLILAVGEFMAGNWDASAAMTDRANTHLARAPFPMLRWTAWHAEALLAAGRGDAQRCTQLCDRMRQWAIPRGLGVVDRYLAHAAGLCALGQRDFETAYHQFESISAPGYFAPNEPFALWVVFDLVESAERTGRHREAAEHVQIAFAAGIDVISPRLALLCAGARALVAESGIASQMFERALASPDGDRWPFDRARIELNYGEHLRRIRATTQARRHLEAAKVVFVELGAVPWMERAESELDATSRTRHAAGTSSPQLLTPQEHTIALLGAQGLTNRQIGEQLYLSPRTIGAHLYRIFPKLDIATRAGLRDALVDADAGLKSKSFD